MIPEFEEFTQHLLIRNTKSIHQNLIDAHEDEERERLLDHLERKEAMEEKMVNTKQMVRYGLKYTSYRIYMVINYMVKSHIRSILSGSYVGS